MNRQREFVIQTASSDSGLPAGFARRVISDTPWLDGTEALSEALAPELLAEEASAFGVSPSKLLEFVDRYNTLVAAEANPQAVRQTEAYVSIGRVTCPRLPYHRYGTSPRG
jgi:hypothetical protein